ncbi:aspartate aminotransferase [Penicillium atrosanguineum]|uniref:Aspartate aminotransferase n=1 Tax=Penicillium atrosanguineum TaxID=1132637 RepID=A0A9W9L4I8_9EURO|nr:aspartate aminotransferase [Penicillium atrosanguineum]KAJ5303258.1 aspartate aminotransferase [Penicillium atrosanguineum]
MVHVKPFVLDNWVRQFKPSATASLHDTCVDPLSLQALSQLTTSVSVAGPVNASNALVYGSVLGSSDLRTKILSLYDEVPDTTRLSLTVTQGAISANFLVLDTILGFGDHVICQYPTYQQLYDVPRRAGAEVSLWRTQPENGWIPDMLDLVPLVKDNTKMIIINNPNNPTGASIPGSVLKDLVSFAAKHNIIVFSDEVFRPLFHGSSIKQFPSIISFAQRYKNVIVVSSLSKAFSLPGIRVGWAISPDPELIRQVIMARDYTTISVSQVDQDIAAYALDPPVREMILRRSLTICGQNLTALDEFIKKHANRLRWVKPTGASAAFVCVVDPATDTPVDDPVFCENLISETGLLIVPGGKTFGTEIDEDFKGYLRVGFVCSADKFKEALAIWGKYLDQI